ncbi:putative prolyl 4-hydroxylase 3 [Gossypium australe]|uniref:Putative prolyl 4-hydroxylase 3 n=1 Tax=Gossypium australe TaxID=47621 RepID=A0A5B6VIL6_9ROSI|nr:putative prolyl 4-hydroxylase 3 [Gossypium australe]
MILRPMILLPIDAWLLKEEKAWGTEGSSGLKSFHRSLELSFIIISWEECEYLINLAKPYMKKSTVVDSKTGQSKDSRVRTSSGMFLRRGQDKIIMDIEKRIADYTFIPVGQMSKKGGLGVKSKMGDALLVWSTRPDATLDPSRIGFSRLDLAIWNWHPSSLCCLLSLLSEDLRQPLLRIF